ncbi:MAG: sn-glycerol-1-phosphate dehydrogenase [Alphaproteobacteria bacterium]|nr:sn-glycerol-1-phosphate dehydrogenase [Alphaproteobacteria bacterium]
MTSQDPIDRLLAGTYPDPDGGPALRVSTKKVVIAPTLTGAEDSCLDGLELGGRLAVVSDPITHDLMGARIERALAGRAKVQSLVLPDHPHADEVTSQRIAEATKSADGLVAVGAGTINDLCKFATAGAGKPYVVYGTAPSMNGYVSTTAAITVHGHKKSLAAQAPLGVFLDLGVLASAPPRMIRSGLGDSLCRTTSQADWLLAHLLFDSPYRLAPFVLLSDDEEPLFSQSDALMRGDLPAMERLVRTLLLSGFGTAICGSSHPASQGEHLISHFTDMLGDPAWPPAFHGEQIAVTTLTMARLQEHILRERAPQVTTDAADEAKVITVFGEDLGRSCWKDFAQKRLDARRAEAVNARLASGWDRIRGEIERIIRPATNLDRTLQRAGAPRTADDLGWPGAFYAKAVENARLIRNRYTFLDFAANSGMAVAP